MAIVEISVAPLGTGEGGVSRYVAACVELVKASGLNYELTPMGTVIEGEIDELFPLLQRMHEAPFGMAAQRVSTLIKLDDRRDGAAHDLKGKVAVVEDRMKTHPNG
ncbi:MAG: hypothetical protein C0616_15380 [Desulfuromonas sp.]|nr:MAG: hypothetical protein C0616_15380 [Desulfuromonas sp.]